MFGNLTRATKLYAWFDARTLCTIVNKKLAVLSGNTQTFKLNNKYKVISLVISKTLSKSP